jgi:hypothetical protein
MRIDVHAHYWTDDLVGAGGSQDPRSGTSFTSRLSVRVHE